MIVGGEQNREQVRVREVAVILRFFLAAHGARFVPVWVVKTGFLHHRAAAFKNELLPLNLIGDGALEEAEGVQVLDFRARAQRRRARGL